VKFAPLLFSEKFHWAGPVRSSEATPVPSAGATGQAGQAPVKWVLPFTTVNFTGRSGAQQGEQDKINKKIFNVY